LPIAEGDELEEDDDVLGFEYHGPHSIRESRKGKLRKALRIAHKIQGLEILSKGNL